MEKKRSSVKQMITIISNLGILLCLAIGFILLFNTYSPGVIKNQDFINYMKDKGYGVIDVQGEKKYPGVETYLSADGACPYSISYIIFNDKNTRDNYFTYMSNDVENGNKNVHMSTHVGISYDYDEDATSGDYYKAVTLNENSILYASGDKAYKKDIDNIFNRFDYKFHLSFESCTASFVFFGVGTFIGLVIFIASMWGTFRKTRNKGYIALIPFYNIGCLTKDIMGSQWYALLLLIPIVNIIFIFMLYYKLGKSFDKDEGYCLLLMIFPSVFWPLVAFDNSSYNKLDKKKKKSKKQNIHNSVIKQTDVQEIKQENQVGNAFKWLVTTMLFLFSLGCLLVYLDEDLILYLINVVMFALYGLLACPAITRYTWKFKTYTNFKPLIVIILAIIDLILFGVLPS